MPITRVQAFLMSLLTRQLALAQGAFLTRYNNCWLVWEPGEDSVPVSGVDVSVAVTKLPTAGAGHEQRPLGGDALCFALKVFDDGTTLKVGRAADNEVVVSDLTISRLHAQLELKGADWSLVALSETKKTLIDGRELARGTAVTLQSGQVLELGGVTVTFYDAQAFKGRLAASTRPKS